MSSDDEFAYRLIGFGLSEKVAQTYLYLLKYSPKTPSPLAKSLHTYREDVHRTRTSLIEKGMVLPSLESPTIYTAVAIEREILYRHRRWSDRLKFYLPCRGVSRS